MKARISTLLQAFQALAPIYFGKRFVLTSGDRDCARQLELSGPTSYHITGEAFDGVLQPYDARSQALLGAAAVELGFRWGGNFKSADVVHFDDGLRGAPGSCPTLGGSNLLSLVTSELAAFIRSRGSTIQTKGSGPIVFEVGGVSYSSNQTGSPARQTCIPGSVYYTGECGDDYPLLIEH